ncbi:hypothetical protein G7059_01470 [Erysipelothrix sp. HDW6A]|uniref:hypothetical protein n=1 Tax=Erysipelothrix sp. HDW6A TaxID=2714928 RepID=UPI00140901FA|nr:hypothetical protein [Erysipelothrix sp. HDW6A]QIK56605.1 hypothetical protein G7059_01470 [Erysipelothrix sp. HDW6A]
MSSIAYISDEKMIEYIRSSGSRNLNFWRLSMRNFDQFSEGSLLFFVDGRYMHSKTREKGIIGYGQAAAFTKMSVDKMWEKYETQNGYHNRDSFIEALQSTNKAETLPKTLQSIELNNIIFFKGPIYLSEVGDKMPKQLESYMYLDKDEQLTQAILDKALKIGIDSWYSSLNPELSLREIVEDKEEQEIRETLYRITHPWSTQQFKLIQVLKEFRHVNGIAYDKKDNQYTIYLPCTSARTQQYAIVGIIETIKKENKDKNLVFSIVLRESAKSSDLFSDYQVVHV